MIDARRESDRDLGLRLCSGDPHAFDDIYRQMHRPCRALALRLLHADQLADDVVQEVFTYLWSHPDAYRAERGGLLPWLLVLTHRRAIDVMRNRSAEQRRIDRSAREPAPFTSPGADEPVLRAERSAMVRRALATLTTAQRETLVLAYYEGLTQSEIAARMGVPLGTVKGRCYAAMRRLAAHLDRLQDSEISDRLADRRS